ncbi:MAG TPA: hypothetical protein VGH96_13840, partial [Streptosporangiaceae bacterium]
AGGRHKVAHSSQAAARARGVSVPRLCQAGLGALARCRAGQHSEHIRGGLLKLSSVQATDLAAADLI